MARIPCIAARDDQRGAAEGLAGRSGWRGIVPATSGLEDRRSTEKALGNRGYFPQQALRRRLTAESLRTKKFCLHPVLAHEFQAGSFSMPPDRFANQPFAAA